VPRSSHAQWDPPADRPDPVAVLEAQAATRVPELVPVRHGRMLASPFSYYRGAAAAMAWDLARAPTSGIRVQACGDAHLLNFGMFAAPDRRLVFDLNDFDETLPAPFEWDVKRLAASLEVAGRDRGFADADRDAIILSCVRAYREAMAGFAAQSNLEVFYAVFDVEHEFARYRSTVSAKMAKRADKDALSLERLRELYTRYAENDEREMRDTSTGQLVDSSTR